MPRSGTDKVVISDTRCLAALDRIGQLELLRKIFRRLVATPTVKEEFGKDIPDWIEVHEAKDSTKMEELASALDRGKAFLVIAML